MRPGLQVLCQYNPLNLTLASKLDQAELPQFTSHPTIASGPNASALPNPVKSASFDGIENGWFLNGRIHHPGT